MTRIGEKWQRCPKRKLTPLIRARLKERNLLDLEEGARVLFNLPQMKRMDRREVSAHADARGQRLNGGAKR